MDQTNNSVGKSYAYEIKGGKPLRGDIEISGSKNAALGVIAASIMVDGACTLENVPDILDVHVMFDLLRSLGAKVDAIDNHSYRIDPIRSSRIKDTCFLLSYGCPFGQMRQSFDQTSRRMQLRPASYRSPPQSFSAYGCQRRKTFRYQQRNS